MDTEYLVRKLRAGADFAIAQLFFEADDFLRMRDRVAAAGCEALLLPGVMPLTTPTHPGQDRRAVRRAGAGRAGRAARTRCADDPKAFRAAGMDVMAELCERLLAEGVPSLHFYTFNRSKATKEIVDRLGLVPGRTASPVG